MAKVIGDSTSVDVEFTALELDLLREIAFNTRKTLNQLVAERMRDGIDVEVPGEDGDYEFKYNPAGLVPGEQIPIPEIDLKELGYDEELLNGNHRFNLQARLLEFYNIAWTHGVESIPGGDLDNDLRASHVEAYVNLLLNSTELSDVAE